MKFLAFFALLFLFVDLSHQIPKLVNCSADFVLTESMARGCGVITCDGPDKMMGVGCSQWVCQPGKTVGYKSSDTSKPYPECCGGPICMD